MELQKTKIADLFILKPSIFSDSRGYFMESFNKKTMESLGISINFVQDNQSRSEYGVVRGLHFQSGQHAQSKLVRVLEGAIYDVAVDLRKGSETFGQWFGSELSAENQLQMLVPKGFAHGFSVLSPSATVFYKCDTYYNKASEQGIRFDDPELGIDWRLAPEEIILSEKDRDLPTLNQLKQDL